MKGRYEFNINAKVKVKLTETGKEELKRQHKQSQKEFLQYLADFDDVYKEDEDGYTSIQLWVLMIKFGHTMNVFEEPPFTTKMVIEGSDLKCLDEEVRNFQYDQNS